MDHHIPILKRKHHKFVDHTKDTCTKKNSSTLQLLQLDFFAMRNDGQICQIAAKDENDENPWSINILPNGKFVPLASMGSHQK